MTNVSPKKTLESLLSMTMEIVDQQYQQYINSGTGDIHPSFLNFMKEARQICQTIYTTKVLDSEVQEVKIIDKFKQKFKLIYNELPDEVKGHLKLAFNAREEDI